MSRPRRPGPAPVRRQGRPVLVTVVALAALLVVAVAGWGVYQSQRSDDYPTPASATAEGTGLVDGQGPVTVDIWLDPHCPHCRTFEQEAGPVLDRLVEQGAVTRVYHPVGFLDRFSTTEYATRAAASVGCAADAGRHVRYVSELLAAQPPPDGPGLTDDELVEVGAAAGVTGPAFAECVRDRRYRGWVEQVTAAAAEADVTGTPTVRVDGADVQPTAEEVEAAVRRAAPERSTSSPVPS